MHITRHIYDSIHELIQEQPNISSRALARKLGINKETAAVWRTRNDFKDNTKTATIHDSTSEYRLKQENIGLRKRVNDLLEQQSRIEEYANIVNRISEARIKTPEWAQKHSKGGDNATAVAFASDWHLDEVVKPEQIGGCNAFNREIAETRIGQFFDHVDRLCHVYVSGIKLDGLYLFIGGDIFSGNIHEELEITNESTIIESLIYWIPIVASGIKHLADKFNYIHIPCVAGNHGRRTRKPIAKNRAQDNFDYLFCHMLAMQLRDDNRITWDISESADCRLKIYDHTILLTHGDQFRGGSGISGPVTPWALGDHRKRKRMQGMGQPYDTLVFGHWHTLTLGVNGMIVNGCFTPDTLIQRTDGTLVPIEHIKIDDTVLTHNNRSGRVTAVLPQKSIHGLVSLKVRGLPHVIRTTPNHQIWTIKGEATKAVAPKYRPLIGHGDKPQWIPADFISSGDWVSVPVLYGTESPITENLAWLYGLYLAEGWTTGGHGKIQRIELCMHLKEHPILERAAAIFVSEFAPENACRIEDNVAGNSCSLILSDIELAKKFRAMFGHRAWNKRIPPEFMQMTNSLKSALLQGWRDGDGSSQPGQVPSATTTSPDMAMTFFQFALAAGLRPSLSSLKAGGRRKRDSYTIHFTAGQESRVEDDTIFYRVEHRFRSNEITDVFDLEVDGYHTYNAGFIGVHNSLKGYDEYAYVSNFSYEPPQQALWLVQPRVGITGRWPIHVLGDDEDYSFL